MIAKKHLVEIGVYRICKKGRGAFTLAAPGMWLRYSGAALGDKCVAFTDKRDNSLHFYLKPQPRRYP
jgi:hypothetical protein